MLLIWISIHMVSVYILWKHHLKTFCTILDTNFINCSSLLANLEPEVVGLEALMTVWGDLVPLWTYLLMVSLTDPNSAPSSLLRSCLSLDDILASERQSNAWDSRRVRLCSKTIKSRFRSICNVEEPRSDPDPDLKWGWKKWWKKLLRFVLIYSLGQANLQFSFCDT